jgi:amidase
MQNEIKIPELIQKPALEIQTLLKTKDIHPMDLLEALESRISDVDGEVNALPTLCFERARKHAESTDFGEKLLQGLPVAIKDLEDVSKVKTTYGSKIYKDHIPEESDLLVEHLESNGAIVYAKSNTPEFGTGGNTINKVFGPTRNPWNTQMSAAGSSGGAAAALATGTAWLAQGSDMGGSLRNPASFCHIVGMRPSIGRIASNLSSNVIDTLSTHGPMARNVTDLALLMDAMCGHESESPLSLPSPKVPFLQTAQAPEKPKKIAFSMDLGITPVDPQVKSLINRAIDTLTNEGFEIEQCHPDFSGLDDVFRVLRARSYAAGMGHLLEKHEADLNPNVVWNIKQGLALSIDDINQAEVERVAIVQRVHTFFDKYEALLTPATIVPPYPVVKDHVEECDGHVFDNYYQWLAIAYAFTTTLCPALSLPCGLTHSGLPVGLQIASASYKDRSVISTAAAIETILNLETTTPINPRSPETI